MADSVSLYLTKDEDRIMYEYAFDQMGYKSAYFGYTDDGAERDFGPNGMLFF